jgi:hypothetical protein
MAKITPTGISGKVGDVVFYMMNGKNYVRSAPRVYHTLEDAKKINTALVLATRITKAIWGDLKPVIPYPADFTVRDRLKSDTLNYVEKGIRKYNDPGEFLSNLNGFEFTQNSLFFNLDWVKIIQIRRASPETVKIRIPAFFPKPMIDAPIRTESVTLTMAMSVCYPKTGAAVGSAVARFEFPYTDLRVPEKILVLKLPTPKKSLLVTGLSLRFNAHHSYALYKSEREEYLQSQIVLAGMV